MVTETGRVERIGKETDEARLELVANCRNRVTGTQDAFYFGMYLKISGIKS